MRFAASPHKFVARQADSFKIPTRFVAHTYNSRELLPKKGICVLFFSLFCIYLSCFVTARRHTPRFNLQ